jgi:TFIIF-interacting CTD phosphatase-like protein
MQSCKQVGNSFVKDLTLIERDLSRVAIIDNTPGAYMHHQGAYYMCVESS